MNNDGILDIISGCYNVKGDAQRYGHIYWLKGLADGKYAKAEFVKNKEGKRILEPLPAEGDKGYIQWIGTIPSIGDLNGDKITDLLIGTHTGRLLFLKGSQEDNKLVWSSPKPVLDQNKEEIKIQNGKAAPTLADWDQDGDLDIVVSNSKAAVLFIENIGTKTVPVWSSNVVTLIPDTKAEWDQDLSKAPLQRGDRAKVAVVDWNNDGKPDLLLGDRTTVKGVGMTGHVWVYIRK